jgi:hypothetical protein
MNLELIGSIDKREQKFTLFIPSTSIKEIAKKGHAI